MDKYCPKCKTNFSDLFDECVYCGTVLVYGTVYCGNEEQKHEKDILSMTDKEILKKYQSYRYEIEKQTGALSDEDFVNGIKSARRDSLLDESSSIKNRNENNEYNKIECPYCHGKDTTKISTTSKIINTAIFGPFGTKRYKQWHCNECNSDF